MKAAPAVEPIFGDRGQCGASMPASGLDALDRALESSMLRMAIENMSQGLCMFDANGRLVVCNERYARIYGLDATDVLPGTPVAEVLRRRIAAGMIPSAHAENYIEHVLSMIGDGKSNCRFVELVGGRTVAVEFRPFEDGGWVATHEDVTEHTEMKALLAQHALRDALTLLPNRPMLLREIDALPPEDCVPGLGLFCIDIDRFREINLQLGHCRADALLKSFAERLVGGVRAGDLVARISGDQFSVLCRKIAPGDIDQVAARVQHLLSAPFAVDDHEFLVTTSIGVATGDASERGKLLQQAETAMRSVKMEAAGSLRQYDPTMQSRICRARRLVKDVRKALGRGEFEIWYQPILSARTSAVEACEALLRWNHPDLGLVSPDCFIPLLEDAGLIGEVGEWAIQQAARECLNWPARVRVAVNVSANQFKRRAVVPAVLRALGTAGLPAGRLELEITETAALLASADTRKSMHELRALGVQFAMDDFGTGYSSLLHVHEFPFDRIKIDRCFLRDGGSGTSSLQMLQAVFAMARTLGIPTTAEGIETHEQAAMVRAMECDELQGFALARPMEASQLARLWASLPTCERAA